MIPIKRGHEIEMMRRAGSAAATVRDALVEFIVPGKTTSEIDRAAAALMAEAGVKSAFLGYRKFPGNICVSVNDEVIHGIGGSRIIQYGDIVKLDIGVVRDGWIGDTAITVPVGMIDPETERLCTMTEKMLLGAIALARPGNRRGEISAYVDAEARAAGFSVVREFVGHGIGRRLHEEPEIPNFGKRTDGPVLKPGMTLAIEPMINLGAAKIHILDDKWTVVTRDGKPSAHFEHTILVTENEPEILTRRQS